MAEGPLETLKARVAAGEMDANEAQLAVAVRLDKLSSALASQQPQRRWSLGSLFGSPQRPPAPTGLYTSGKVGRGKTVLMDLFHQTTPVASKRRMHFQEFMAEVHDRIAEARKTLEGDPIPHVATEIADSAHLLCFDELHVTDIADAMILGRLFKGLFDRNVVMVATSNVPPEDLYKNGLNRQLFLPSIALIQQHMDVIELESSKDFRLEKLEGQQLYFTPADDKASAALAAAFKRLTGLAKGRVIDLDVKGRTLRVPEGARGVARFTFDELCDRPLGALDYLALAHRFHTLILEGIPILVPERRAAARRFINLIDTLYDANVGLIASAEAEPDDLHPKGDESFLFERTASRLIEMRSSAYLESRQERLDKAMAARTENAET
ncbi:MAG: cell division protein ZapE [Hyphomicrobiaceae bacterium]